MNCSTSLSVSVISSSRNISKPIIERDSFADNVILGDNKNTTFHSCHRKETPVHVCTMTYSVKGTAYKQRIQQVLTTSASASAVYTSAIGTALDGSKRLGLNLYWDFPSDPSVSSLKAPSFSESARASLTASAKSSTSASARTNTSNCGSGGG